MIITFKKHSHLHTQENTTIEYRIEDVLSVDDLLDHFKRFLQACGYVFEVEEYFMVYNPEEEEDASVG